MSENRKINRQNFPEQIADQLAEIIIYRKMKPGDKFPPELTLAAEYGVSRSVVREALRILAAQGIIEVINGKGALVREIDNHQLRSFFKRSLKSGTASVRELMEVRIPLEVTAAGLAARRRSMDQIAEMIKITREMPQLIDDMQAYTDYDFQFHILIAEAAGNTTLLHLISSIRESIKDLIRLGLEIQNSGKEKERIQKFHETIVSAIAEGDREASEREMTAHLTEALNALEQ